MGFENEKNSSILSKLATNEEHGENSPYFDGWKAYDNDPFHPLKNPNGVIQMGLAENQLCFDLIEEWIKRNPNASICTTEGIKSFRAIANFQDYHGLPEFRSAIAKFMEKTRGGRVTFDPERVVMAGGATGANETIIFCLADTGDAFLVPSPYYPAFNRDLRWRTGVQLIPIPCDSSNNFQITTKAVREAYENAQKSNIKVKGLILTNPSNPLGTTLDRDTLKNLLTFTNQHNIHLVCDEIYAATVFNTPQFVSIAEILDDETSHCNKDLVHIVYSLSKDMGLPGFRVGIVYSFNDAVVNCARKMSSFGLVSTQTQYLLAEMLSDERFVSNFLTESSKRLAKRHKHFTNGLEEVGIKCLRSNAGLFCWMDLRPLLKESTFDSEMSLWRVIINDVKLNVSPGSSFDCQEPGFFRVCFANMDDETVDIALARIRSFVGVKKSGDESTPILMEKKQQWKKNNLRLSFSKRMYDESVNLSPLSSPIPHSPLVRART
ncbi:1-aminocyclopropane-1-carboxylate synthase [Nicotiana tabacum]|uniref:1-aminocyclopropane-1-carboxylate synthase n=1 Tax=Nicotiana sylvestris TaxID=4096 RepID=A0A1U7X7J0_NICSY|nr:1-aminocyclopropane-1-carboxylate synthase [Nicotiana tabacum]XP_009786813.1 PREDICTED: 1-aminocyclopropane-1-carboxylate synthase [Nicotiana sylvestris]